MTKLEFSSLHIEGAALSGKTSLASAIHIFHPRLKVFESTILDRPDELQASKIRYLKSCVTSDRELLFTQMQIVEEEIDSCREQNGIIQTGTLLIQTLAHAKAIGLQVVVDRLIRASLKHPKYKYSFVLNTSYKERLIRHITSFSYDNMVINDPDLEEEINRNTIFYSKQIFNSHELICNGKPVRKIYQEMMDCIR